MKIVPAILLVIAGAAFAGWVLEWLTSTGGRETPGLQELATMLAEWLSRSLLALAELMRDRH